MKIKDHTHLDQAFNASIAIRELSDSDYMRTRENKEKRRKAKRILEDILELYEEMQKQD